MVGRTMSESQREIWKIRESFASLGGMFSQERVITVRVSRRLHAALRLEAFEKRTSLNQLCVAKLLQPIDAEFVPSVIDA